MLIDVLVPRGSAVVVMIHHTVNTSLESSSYIPFELLQVFK